MLFGSTLNRMIFIELVKVFLLSLGSLTGLFLLAGIIQQAIQLGLSPTQILSALPLFIPSTLPYTIPATTLFASCVVYGRLAHDNEVVAIKSAGVHLFTVLQPAMLLGFLTTAITAGLYYEVIPHTQQQLQEELLKDPEEALYSTLRRERCLRHPNSDFVMYVRDVQGRRLIDVVLKQRAKLKDKSGADVMHGYDFVFRARTAQLRVDVAEGMMYIDPDRFVVYNPRTLLRLRNECGEAVGANLDPSHLFWQGIDIESAIAELGRAGAIFHTHAKDTAIQPRNAALNGVLDTVPLARVAERSWIFRTVGHGHSELEWRRILIALRMAGYDDVLSIEHEDALLSIDEGFRTGVAFLRSVMPVEPPLNSAWWT